MANARWDRNATADRSMRAATSTSDRVDAEDGWTTVSNTVGLSTAETAGDRACEVCDTPPGGASSAGASSAGISSLSSPSDST